MQNNIEHLNDEVIELHKKVAELSVNLIRLTKNLEIVTKLVRENNNSVNIRITNNEETSDQNKEYHESLFRRVNEKFADQDERLLELEGANDPKNYKPAIKPTKVSEK